MKRQYEPRIKSEEADLLMDAILTLKNREECYRFFEDVCTINEIRAIAQRLQVAQMLREKRTYIDIADTTGASTATISRVNRALNYGSDGYKIIFERLDKMEKEKSKSKIQK
ncbi:MAG TPA: TrpR-like protein YerC/YecD [Clostridiaceae bacterium]|jgi:TrpR-related protein YerC/YecD|nr:TrpR-like protein YerC/YecD [Clostridiaceae bacterium]HBG38563.1 TrpR-like protein YerC/YecD [Clostridiaceae bacterium]HBN27580.1 TrpR-like protein YerC/YecD [Clostridiaceae bacterium]HCL51026.1 TrpR-like protein YerC/YecD [Clostridiaceae bacterium]